VLLVWPRLPRPLLHIPAPLVAVVGATAFATMLELEVERVALPGSLVDSLSLPEVPGGSWGGVLTGVLTVALIASVESLLSAVAVDKLSAGGTTDFDRELVGQGAANTVSGMLGGLPVTGVIVRSSANVAAGADQGVGHRARCLGDRVHGTADRADRAGPAGRARRVAGGDRPAPGQARWPALCSQAG